MLIEKYLTWLKIEGKSALTIKNYTSDLGKFKEYLDKEKKGYLDEIELFNSITLEDLEQYKLGMIQADFAATTINRRIASLRKLFEYLRTHKIIKEDIARDLSNVKDKRYKEKIYLNKKESKELIDKSKVTKTKGRKVEYANARNNLMIRIALNYGLRNEELSDLKVDQVDKTGKVTFQGKRDKWRSIYLSASDFELYKEYLKIREDELKNKEEYIFLSTNGKHLHTNSIREILQECLANTNIEKKITPHTLRHSFATNSLLDKVPISVVSKILGHTKVSTTFNTYTHAEDEAIRDACQKSLYE